MHQNGIALELRFNSHHSVKSTKLRDAVWDGAPSDATRWLVVSHQGRLDMGDTTQCLEGLL